ncbi:HD family phosphohydrolase [Alkalihalobacterium chitinilyticum]|uniref:HD family phosphohydrolase n=1 Tax=Alkalihalobacterium chitinilyticum TaxID=2980103 RepID=A0ABT5VEM0_9BACI|nr:HD family phosphohydrolase [Alkalihalobacterium chitinilyticum]MDE5413899.1 HD family phosphohydrolase [Alkalihalobacterium chitinilyticum]
MNKRSPIDQMTWWKKIKDHRYLRGVLFVILAVFLFLSMLDNIIPEKIEVRMSSVAEQDIRAPITVENKIATEQKRREVLEAVQPVYALKKEYAQMQVEKINDIFDLIHLVNEEMTKTELEAEAGQETEKLSLEERLTYVQEVISSGTTNDLSDETVRTLLLSSSSQLQVARETTTNAVHSVMSERIAINDLAQAKRSVRDKIAILTVSNRLHDAMIETAQFAIIPNYIYDDKATERLQQEAVESVEPVIIREGQLLVKQGELINHEIYEQLRMVGLLDDAFNIFPYLGLALLVLLMVGMLSYYLNEAQTSVKTNNSHLLMFILIFFIGVSVMKITSLIERLDIVAVGLIVPVAVGAMLLTTLIHQRIALFSSIFFAIIASIIFNNDAVGTFNFTFGVYILFSCFAGVYFLGRSTSMTRILKAGLFVSFINMVTILSILFLKGFQQNWIEVGMYLGFAFLSGFIAAVLTLGLVPFFEAGFGILSTTKLIELSNPNHPLLRRILLEAPGTYHHSVVVGNLAEAACESIGANGLLARVGSYYHDIGKTKRPHFFIENQMKIDNPHDKISPQLSKTIIISHPYDGADMLKEYKMPKEIIDIAEQHHGTTLLKYFYHKANQETDQTIPEEQFRYPGPKAQTKEAAIVGIADCIEAAVRSLTKPTPDKILAMIRKIVTDRLEDGQFNECDLTLKELDKVAVSMYETLQGTFHSRIEYPEDPKEKGAK